MKVNLNKGSSSTKSKIFANFMSVALLILAVVAVIYQGSAKSVYHVIEWVSVASQTFVLLSFNLLEYKDKKEFKDNIRWWNILLSFIHAGIFLYFGWYWLLSLGVVTTMLLLNKLDEV